VVLGNERPRNTEIPGPLTPKHYLTVYSSSVISCGHEGSSPRVERAMEQFHHGPAGAFEQKFMVLNNALFHKYLFGRKWEDVTVRGRMADVDLDLDDTLDLIFDWVPFFWNDTSNPSIRLAWCSAWLSAFASRNQLQSGACGGHL
jgi:hypothetical protein